MTNLEIIMGSCMMANITEEVDTYAGWNRRGYQVQKGEKAAFITKIWKPVKRKGADQDEAEDKLILVNAAFFKRSQVAARAATA